MTEPRIHAIIMAGGSGTRFWPASRRALPKQYLRVTGTRSLLAETVRRLEGLVLPEHTLVVTAAAQVDLARAEVPDVPAANVLAEPEARNTAACVALAARAVEQRDPDAVQVVLPADHVIEPREAFQRSVRAAARAAQESGALVTFGIRPTHPATGFGYIEAGAPTDSIDGLEFRAVQRFVEKPDRARAEEFLATGRFLWNAGIFVWQTAAIQAAIAEHFPEAAEALAAVDAGADLASVWSRIPALPVDVAILERAREVRVLPVDYRWNDVGSWSALPAVVSADAAGNVVAGGGALVAEDAEDCVVYGEGDRLTALVGVRGLVVVQAGDAVLVCPAERAQEVRAIVARLAREHPEFL